MTIADMSIVTADVKVDETRHRECSTWPAC